ncbi:MAG: MgtC/SapB family protein [Phycisphaerales bacterium]|nr:MAG: MgtC/SapB family protein [Phycisphaerales bacterium]
MVLSELIVRIGVALVLGACIGAERQWRQRLAGLRTNTLVCLGAALFVMLSVMMDDEISPTRVAAQVVSGIGFLGAGVIFKEGASVRGLNTAATLWCSAAVGVLVGTGFLIEATFGAIAVLAANVLLRPLAARINRQPQDVIELDTSYRLRVDCRQEDENHVRALVMERASVKGLFLRSLSSEDAPDGRFAVVKAELVATGRQDPLLERVLKQIGLEDGVTAISWSVLDATTE